MKTMKSKIKKLNAQLMQKLLGDKNDWKATWLHWKYLSIK